MLKVVNAMHRQNIIHRNIKAEAINLIRLNGKEEDGIFAQLANFGFAQEFSTSQTEMDEQCGTRLYMAPERCQNKAYNEKVDVWALGVLAFYLITGGYYPYYALNKE